MTTTSNSTFTVQLVNTATVVLQYGDLRIVTDPAFDPAGGEYEHDFATLEKTGDPGQSIDQIGSVDIVLLSHDQHADNFDTSGRDLAAAAPLTITTEVGAGRLDGTVVGLPFWATHQIGDVTVTALPSRHGPDGVDEEMGPTIGFLITSPEGPTVYISGDTVPFDGTDEIVERVGGSIDYALVHAGAVKEGEDEPVYFTMTADEAVELASRLDARRFSIIHADSWAHFSELMPEARDVAKASGIADRFIDLSDRQETGFRVS